MNSKLFFLLITLCFGISNIHAQTGSVTTLDGKVVEATVSGIGSDGTLTADGLAGDTNLLDLRKIVLDNDRVVKSVDPTIVVNLDSGGVIYVSSLKLFEDEFTLQTVAGELVLGLEAIRAIRFLPKKSLATFETALKKPSDDLDQVFVKVKDRYQRVPAVLDSISATEVQIVFQDKPRKLTREQVYGAVIAFPSDSVKTKFNAKVTLVDGSVVVGKVLSMADSKLNIKVGVFDKIELPAQSISSIAVKSDRLSFLSEMDPSLVEQKNMLVAVDRKWQRDKSIKGRPMSLLTDAGKSVKKFSKGLGTHAGCRLIFDNEGFQKFSATLGIDAETGGKGDCEFVILGDGEELLKKRIRGFDEPVPVELDISDYKEISLIVNAGENFDLGDHANWCDARFFKTGK